MKKTNFDRYLSEQMRDPEFAARFERANEDWDIALQLAALRQQAGLSHATLTLICRRVSHSVATVGMLHSSLGFTLRPFTTRLHPD